jgi:hypothetical protein
VRSKKAKSAKTKAAQKKAANPGPSANQQVAAFIAKFDPKIAKLIRECRAALRKRFSTALELVYDNYNFFVIGFAATDRASSCIVALAANGKGVGLSFYWGATLPDPHKLLQGSGSQNRFVRLLTAKTLVDPRVVALINDAVAQAKTPLPTSTRGYTIIKSISAKQRSRR